MLYWLFNYVRNWVSLGNSRYHIYYVTKLEVMLKMGPKIMFKEIIFSKKSCTMGNKYFCSMSSFICMHCLYLLSVSSLQFLKCRFQLHQQIPKGQPSCSSIYPMIRLYFILKINLIVKMKSYALFSSSAFKCSVFRKKLRRLNASLA